MSHMVDLFNGATVSIRRRNWCIIRKWLFYLGKVAKYLWWRLLIWVSGACPALGT
uniref:Uncharacterized protein n=1 Tax=Rhizophora mucronata TaxID=61149 RepID=A0A2P2QF81_RHIMU